jgi:hypothetical protein
MSQASSIARTLAIGGIAPASAQQAANILTNPGQATLSSGPVQVDYTPQAMRFITSSDRKYRFANLDWEDNPVYRASKRARKAPEQEARLANPNRHPLGDSQPITVAQPTNDDQVVPGAWVNVLTQRRNTFAIHTVSLRTGANSGTHARFNQSTGAVDGVEVAWNISQSRYLRGTVTETPAATQLGISLENLRSVRVRLPDSGANPQYQTIICWTDGEPSVTP